MAFLAVHARTTKPPRIAAIRGGFSFQALGPNQQGKAMLRSSGHGACIARNFRNCARMCE